ncbi:hypothetical protein [Chryseobacterium sp. PET-29]|uniref:hypothetical protein n=1 Tax=Chryseobacterium sp. PET-29 TaxID=2983267 RepID=UPI0021E53034|nr:hypothetical protein [Chryseobacterium sp. PET-29]
MQLPEVSNKLRETNCNCRKSQTGCGKQNAIDGSLKQVARNKLQLQNHNLVDQIPARIETASFFLVGGSKAPADQEKDKVDSRIKLLKNKNPLKAGFMVCFERSQNFGLTK